MKERPILFSGPMVRALLDGRKTQSRRVVKPEHIKFLSTGVQMPRDFKSVGAFTPHERCFEARMGKFNMLMGEAFCPCGAPGDRLWVREKWTSTVQMGGGGLACYAYADGSARELLCDNDGEGDPVGIGAAVTPYLDTETRWKPSIHMPRWASRITLEVTGVRVERVQDISEADAKVEGAMDAVPQIVGNTWSHRQAFSTLWESINGPGSWEANPWVWVVEFRRVET